jgi:hypothetical protein
MKLYSSFEHKSLSNTFICVIFVIEIYAAETDFFINFMKYFYRVLENE